ncbi:zinc finger, CCHC-type containing protein [Tanacetum coccineum]
MSDQKHGQRDKGKVKFFACEKFGHYASECPNKKKGEEANLTQTIDEEPTPMMVISQENASSEVFLNEEKVIVNILQTGEPRVESDMWYLDNGASNHMTGDRSKFHKLDERDTGRVKFGDGSTVAIMGKRLILFDCKNDDQQLLNGVYFIPRLESNIISLGQMTEYGSRVEMAGCLLKLFDKSNNLLLRVKRSPNRLYKTLLKTGRPTCLLTT